MLFEVKILGSCSATPVYNRHPSAQLLNIDQHFYLIDCGESTQFQLNRYKVKFNKIDHVFITHLHGDHYLGLIGLISSMHLHGRIKDLHLYGPPGLDEIIIVQMRYSETFLKYKINFHELNTEKRETIIDTSMLTVETIPLQHRIKCCGFLFREKPKKRRINKEMLPANILLQEIAKLKSGEDIFNEDGSLKYKNEAVTLPPKKSRSFAYCTDTIYTESFLHQITGIDLLYHESTFLKDLTLRAKETYHSTAEEAATIALKAGVEKLIIGHFSSRYKDLQPLLSEARETFPNTFLAIEGDTFSIPEE
ncbi:MAG TPA: ribonuclease Z [Cytophagaceae bacterium]|nr:ribonuclease Z [Cytophagaceae bacterium]